MIDKTVTLHNMTAIFSITASTRIQNVLHAFKMNSSDTLFNSSSIAVLTFGREVAFAHFSKTSHIGD